LFAVHVCRGSPIIRYQPCAKPEPTAKSSWWNRESERERERERERSPPYKKIVAATQEKKIKQATNPKTNRLVSKALLGPSKRRKRRVSRDPAPSDTLSDSDTDLAVSFADVSIEEDEEQDADFPYCTCSFSEDHNGEDWIRCAKCFRWAHTLCAGMEEDFGLRVLS
jgi:hypothetical protein